MIFISKFLPYGKQCIDQEDIDAVADVTVYFRAKVNCSVRGDVLNTVNITTSVDDARGNF